MAFRVSLLRPDDLLNVTVSGVNLLLDTTDAAGPTLVVDDRAADAFLIVEFPPQAIVEEAVFQASPLVTPPGDKPKPAPTAKPGPGGVLRSRISGPSRLVFQVPADHPIPYTLEGLLDWSELTFRVSPLAAVPAVATAQEIADAPAIAEPADDVTAIELPYRLVLSPNADVGWEHREAASTHNGRTELWHTRLAHRAEDGTLTPVSRADPAPLRAIWSPDYPAAAVMGQPDQDWDLPDGVLTAMTPSDRREIVIETSAFSGYIKGLTDSGAVDLTSYVPSPVEAEQLLLSPLGGWLKSRGHWNPPMSYLLRFPHGQPVIIPLESLSLSEWVHNATAGRDHYVRIVYEGFVYPFRHRAALIKITERKIRADAHGAPVAFLAQRMFVVIRQPLMDYGPDSVDAGGETAYGRHMPLRQVRLTTLITPDIDLPAMTPPGSPPGLIPGTKYCFWINVGGQPFRFNAVGHDRYGEPVDFTSTMIFVPFTDFAAPAVAAVRDSYVRGGLPVGSPVPGAARTSPVPGQRLAYTERDLAAESDNTTLVTSELHFSTEDRSGDHYDFRPVLLRAAVRLPAVEQLLGTAAATSIAYTAAFLRTGFGAGNETGLFAQVAKETAPGTIIGDTLGATFAASQAGGVATPNLSISALTRKVGPVAGKDLGKLAAGDFKPAEFFADVKASATLFGVFTLADLVVEGKLDTRAPKVQLITEPAGAASKVIAALTWQPALRTISSGIVQLGADGASLTVTGRVERLVAIPPAGNAPAVAEFTGTLANFTISLLNIVEVRVETFSFTSRSGQKPRVEIALKDDPVGFAGDLDFVNELRKAIPPGLFGKGASLDVSSTRVKAGFGIGLPPISIGVFSLEGVNLGAAVELPFADGKPQFDFAVSAREHPFCLTVAFLGGGGFFHLQINTAGVRILEVALEFGASASINLGVASGGVHIMAGIYFATGKKDDADYSILSGFLRMGGELSVLGLISISLEFVLSFGYEAGKAAGRATLSVKVEVVCFSKSVSISVEKKFGGSSGDPRFADVFDTPAIWDEYASAFA